MAPVVFWVCIEIAARVAGTPPLSENDAYVAYTTQRRCQFSWRAAETACSNEPLKHPDTRLLVTLGGSSVFGYPPGIPPFAARLKKLLDHAAPNAWRVVNLGLPCKNSLFLRNCAYRALDAGAEVLVIYAGHNDFAGYGVWNPSRQIWLDQNAWLYDLEMWLSRSRAFSALIRLMRNDTAPNLFPPLPGPAQIAAAQQIVAAAFARRITSVIDAAAARGTRIILSTVVSNLYEHPVKRADWDSSPLYNSAARPDLVAWAQRYREGIARHRSGDFEAALSAFTAARDTFMHGRAPTLLNEQVRELASQHSHVSLIDFERQLHTYAPEGIGCNFFGNDSYCDQFHPNARTHRMIAAALLDKLRELGFVPAPGARPR